MGDHSRAARALLTVLLLAASFGLVTALEASTPEQAGAATNQTFQMSRTSGSCEDPPGTVATCWKMDVFVQYRDVPDYVTVGVSFNYQVCGWYTMYRNVGNAHQEVHWASIPGIPLIGGGSTTIGLGGMGFGGGVGETNTSGTACQTHTYTPVAPGPFAMAASADGGGSVAEVHECLGVCGSAIEHTTVLDWTTDPTWNTPTTVRTTVLNPPNAVDDSLVIFPGGSGVIIPQLNDFTNPPQGTKEIIGVTGGTLGTCALSNSGVSGFVVYQRTDTTSFADDTCVYTVRTVETGQTTTATITIKTFEVPSPPITGSDSAVTDANYPDDSTVAPAGDAAATLTAHPVTVDVLANDTDPNGTGVVVDDIDITAFPATSANGGTVDCGAVPGNGPCVYTPPPNFSGVDTFTYDIEDAEGLSGVGLVVVTVVGNSAPVAASDNFATPLNTSLTGDVASNDSDADGDALTFAVVTPPSDGTLTLNPDGTFTYEPAADMSGTRTFSYSVCDDHTLLASNGSTAAPRCRQATATIRIDGPVPPVAVADFAQTDVDVAPPAFDVLVNDMDGNVPALPLSLNPTNYTTLNGGSVACTAAGSCTYTPPAGFTGTDSFVYTVENSLGESASAAVTITVRGNISPLAMDDFAVTPFETAVNVALSSNDLEVEGENLVYPTTPTVAPANGTVTITAAGVATYTPNAGFSGTDTFTYEVCDDHTLLPVNGSGPAPDCTTASVTINVLAEVNYPPIAVLDSAATTEDASVTMDLLANDFDIEDTPAGIALTMTSVDTETVMGGTIVDNGDGTVEYTPAPGFCGLDIFNYQIADSRGLTAVGAATVVVNCDEPPNAEDDTANTSFNTVTNVSYDTNDSDPEDGAPALDSFDATSTEGGTVADNGDGTFEYTPPADFCGVDSFNYVVIDSNGQTDSATVTVDVTCADQDTDGDGIPDWVEVIICGTTTCADGTEDTDGNGIPDWTEIIICGAAGCVDTENGDEDGDGIPDWVEVIVCGTTTCATGAEDLDGDGIPDWVEVLVCGTVTCANVDDDEDGDGIPDWIEIIICGSATCADGEEDSDGDGVPDWIEITICGTATCAESGDDADGDGIPDWVEVVVCGTATCLDPGTDSDNDGIPDWVEVLVCGTPTCADGTEDVDGNGVPDWQEIAVCGEAGCMGEYLRTKPVGACSNTATFTIPGTLEYDIPNGFRSNTDIRIFMFSEPTLLYAGVLPDSAKITLNIPAGTTPGKHKFMVVGVDDITGNVKIDGCSRNGELPKASTVTTAKVAGTTQSPAAAAAAATATGAKPAAVTGAAVTGIAVLGGVMVLLGAGFMLLTRRRKSGER